MDGVISLVSDFSIDCTLNGRVSLAHLMEFSHFVDLYVLEDNVHFDDCARSVNLTAFDDDPDSPLRTLESENLSRLELAVGQISDYTRSIYDASPTNFSFSMGSYDYWTVLSKEDKRAIPTPAEIVGKTNWRDRTALLASSNALHLNIEIALEELSKTAFTIMPSSRNLIPFLEVFHQMDTPALLLYNRIAGAHRKSMEDVMALARPRTIYLPPLLSVLLSRCESRSDIPKRLIELRAEFTDFRRSIRKWFDQLDRAESVREKIEIREELDDAFSSLVKHYEYKREGFYKQIAGAFVSAAEEGDIKKMLVKPAFAVIKEGVTTLLPEALSVRRFTGLINLMDEALSVERYSSLLGRVFGDSIDISQREITEAKRYKQYVQSKYQIGPPFPS